MGPCSEDPHLCWASRLLGFTSLLLSICCTGVKSSGTHGSGVQDSGAHVHLHRVRGGSVLFHVIRKQEANLEEVTWGFGPDSNYRVLLRVYAGADAPTWVSLQDKYQQRVHVPGILSLKIENLTPEDSGLYRARASFTGGIELNQVFPLTVYEPVPLPQILFKLPSITPSWCNVTLECRASGATEDLNVTWQNKGLPRELEQRVTPGPASNSWTLPVNLPLSQPNASLTCVVSNQVDQKTATLDLGEVCVHDSQGQVSADPLPGILGAVVVVLLILGGGLYLWKTCEKKKKMQTGRGTELQEDHRDNDSGIQYAELSQQESRKDMHKGIGEQHLEEKEPVNTVYSEVHKPEREAMKII
ncbi:SLAM family member 5-like [Balaenoptera ricei]|uniref:SLAM family member 5-like n=1 Tax=Balaenoptera ricei TaxID=2746895 RepID=UPI0028BE8430|nr:SLAM family member 5-like [Balaenoptera ricei]